MAETRYPARPDPGPTPRACLRRCPEPGCDGLTVATSTRGPVTYRKCRRQTEYRDIRRRLAASFTRSYVDLEPRVEWEHEWAERVRRQSSACRSLQYQYEAHKAETKCVKDALDQALAEQRRICSASVVSCGRSVGRARQPHWPTLAAYLDAHEIHRATHANIYPRMKNVRTHETFTHARTH